MAWLTEPPELHPGRRLQALLAREGPLPVPGAFNPLVGLAAKGAGFEALYLSGAALSASWGLADLGLLTLSEVTGATAQLAAVTGLPVLVDADTGFGEALNVARTVRELERAGAAAVQIEDQVMPKRCGHLSGKAVIPAEEMVQKLRAALAARREALVVARTDARATDGLEEAIRRARLYAAAGADLIFPEALTSEEEFARFAEAVPAPLLANMTEFGRTPYIPAARFYELGYKVVIFPVTALRVAMKAVEETFAILAAQGTQLPLLERMQTRAELYRLIDYEAYQGFDREVADPTSRGGNARERGVVSPRPGRSRRDRDPDL